MVRFGKQWSATLLAIASGGSALAQVTTRASLDSAGAQPNRTSYDPWISASGRFVAFWTDASNLVAGDTNVQPDVFFRDRRSGTTERVSVATGGAQANDESRYPSVAADGRRIAFLSRASNLVAGDTNGALDVFVRDRGTGTTERVSVATGGAEGNENSYSFGGSLSADGRFVTFYSGSSNLVPGDTNGSGDVFVRDLESGTTERVSLGAGAVEADADSSECSISSDGRYVVFLSNASNLVPGDTNGSGDVFVRDRQNGTTERVSVGPNGAQVDNAWGELPSISADGRHVAFQSRATTLVAGDTNARCDVFVRDRVLGTTVRASVDGNGQQVHGDSTFPRLSADGRFVAFASEAPTLVPDDGNGWADVFVRNLHAGTIERVSLATGGAEGNLDSSRPSISADGRCVAFESDAWTFVADDTNWTLDVYVRDRDTDGFPSLCEPGAGGVAACPCSNPASGAARGCDNSSATGGAALVATGVASRSADSLVFTTRDQVPASASLLLQGDGYLLGGVLYGQGVRCLGGSMKRLFVKTAVGGSITAPDFAAGDPAVSARSASLGDPIGPGQSRWYLVAYRDPIVLGACPPTSSFNATQTRQATWAP